MEMVRLALGAAGEWLVDPSVPLSSRLNFLHLSAPPCSLCLWRPASIDMASRPSNPPGRHGHGCVRPSRGSRTRYADEARWVVQHIQLSVSLSGCFFSLYYGIPGLSHLSVSSLLHPCCACVYAPGTGVFPPLFLPLCRAALPSCFFPEQEF